MNTWPKITASTSTPRPVAIQAATISLATSPEALGQANAPAIVARMKRPSRPTIRSITIDATAWVFLMCIRTR